MNTRDLEAFVAVVDTGSIVGASARLKLTQPGVTRRVQNLEFLLGAELLDRQSKPLSPTRSGLEVYELGQEVLRSVRSLRRRFTNDEEFTGEFRFGVTPFLSELALQRPIDQLRLKYPKLSLRIASAWSPGLLSQVEANKLDAAALLISSGESIRGALASECIGVEPVVFVAAKDLALPKKPSLSDLSRHAWILNQEGCGLRRAVRQRLRASHLPFEVAVEAFEPELQLSLVRRSLGIGVVTKRQLARSAFRKDLKVVQVDEMKIEMSIWFVSRHSNVQALAPTESLREEIRKLVG